MKRAASAGLAGRSLGAAVLPASAAGLAVARSPKMVAVPPTAPGVVALVDALVAALVAAPSVVLLPPPQADKTSTALSANGVHPVGH